MKNKRDYTNKSKLRRKDGVVPRLKDLSKNDKPVDSFPHDLCMHLLDMKLKGEDGSTMRLYIQQEFPQFTEEMVEKAISHTYSILSSLSQENVFDIVSKHIIRYEEIYKWFRERNLTQESAKVLLAKERLMGLHSNNIDIEINNMFGENTDDLSQFNELQLSVEELQRFHYLIDKASV